MMSRNRGTPRVFYKRQRIARGGILPKNKVEASVARCLRTPPDGAYPARTLSIGITNRLRSLRYRSIVVVGNYGLARYVGAISGKSTSFTPSSILFRPHWWSRRVLPPGPIGLLRRPFIAISDPCGTA